MSTLALYSYIRKHQLHPIQWVFRKSGPEENVTWFASFAHFHGSGRTKRGAIDTCAKVILDTLKINPHLLHEKLGTTVGLPSESKMASNVESQTKMRLLINPYVPHKQVPMMCAQVLLDDCAEFQLGIIAFAPKAASIFTDADHFVHFLGYAKHIHTDSADVTYLLGCIQPDLAERVKLEQWDKDVYSPLAEVCHFKYTDISLSDLDYFGQFICRAFTSVVDK